jgi:hypothetical protein
MLVGYVIAVALSWRYEWIAYPYVTLTMGAAILPDLNRIELALPASTIETVLGIPWSWVPLHRVSGTLLIVCLGSLLAPTRLRRRVFALLAVGATSHYTLDLMLYKPSGLSGPFLWPLTDHRFAIEGIYLSSDRWPALVMITIAAAVWYLDRRRARANGEASVDGSTTDNDRGVTIQPGDPAVSVDALCPYYRWVTVPPQLRNEIVLSL